MSSRLTLAALLTGSVLLLTGCNGDGPTSRPGNTLAFGALQEAPNDAPVDATTCGSGCDAAAESASTDVPVTDDAMP